MNKDLEQLVELSGYDKEIVGFEPKIQAENDKLKVFLKTVNELSQKIDKLYLEIDDAKNKRIKHDIHLKELSDKLNDIASKYSEVKTDKEMKALQLEEEIAKEQIDFANNEILRLDEITSSKESEVEDLKTELKDEEEGVQEFQKVIATTIEELEKSREIVFKNKSELMEKIDNKILAFYEKIKRWAGESAVVPIKNQACYGCHMKLTNRSYSDFLITDEISTCPHCGRIIYKAVEESAE